jgi:RNA polymerase sigma-70 factor (ECF subfamily)
VEISDYSDYDLIKRILAGNKELFSELVTRYKKLVFNVVYNMIHDKQEVNDMSQEIFIRIYQSLHRYNPQFKFSTWSVKIATNYCLDAMRKKKIDSLPIDEVPDIPSNGDTPEVRYIKKEQSIRIKKAIENLPEKYKIPVILFHQNGLSYEEITKVLNEPMTIVKNRLYRARLMLREELSGLRKEEIS